MVGSSVYQFTFYSWVMCVTAVVGVALTVAAVHRRSASGAKYLALVGVFVTEWALAYVFESAATALSLKTLWSQIAYVGTVGVPMSYCLFALDFSEYQHTLNLRNVLLLGIIPILTLLAAATNNVHHRFWPTIAIDPSTKIAIYGHGPLFWIWIAYAYVLLCASIVVLVVTILRSPGIYRLQSGVILVGILLPLAGNIVYISELNPVPGLDWTPVAFVLSGLVLLFGVFGLQILELVPLARGKFVSIMPDGMLVVDTNNRVADMNVAMEATIGLSRRACMGRPADQVLAGFEDVLALLHVANTSDVQREIRLGEPPAERYFDARRSVLRDSRGRLAGRFIVMHDVGHRKRVELERERLISSLQEALGQVKTLQGLVPICSTCKKIRDDAGYWRNVEHYMQEHSEVQFTHSVCPECLKAHYPGE